MNVHNWSMTHTHIGEPFPKNCTTEKEIRLLGVKVGLRAGELATSDLGFSKRGCAWRGFAVTPQGLVNLAAGFAPLNVSPARVLGSYSAAVPQE